MWQRAIEICLGIWLVLSPFIFAHPDDARAFWMNDFASGTAIFVFSVLSFAWRTRMAYLFNFAVAAWLIGFGFLHQPPPAPPALQNDIIIGLLLLIFAIIPNDSAQPPRGWRNQIDLAREKGER